MQSFKSRSLCGTYFYGYRGRQTQGPPRAAHTLATPRTAGSCNFGIEQLYSNIVMALEKQPSEATASSIPNQHRTALGEIRMWEKNIRLSNMPTYTGWITMNPKVDLYLTAWKKVKFKGKTPDQCNEILQDHFPKKYTLSSVIRHCGTSSAGTIDQGFSNFYIQCRHNRSGLLKLLYFATHFKTVFYATPWWIAQMLMIRVTSSYKSQEALLSMAKSYKCRPHNPRKWLYSNKTTT